MKHLNKLDLNLLKTFDVLMDECNVSRAAERLSLTQPAVSGMLTRLRDSLGDPLFVRAQHGMIPTDRALQLAAPIKRLLHELDDLVQPQTFNPAEAELTLTMAGTDYSLSTIMVPLMQQLAIEAPGIRIAAEFIRDDRVFQKMERGDLDLAFMTPDTAPEGLHGRTLFDETYVCALSQQHPLAQTPELTLEQFCSQPQAIVSYQGGRFEGITDQVLATQGQHRKVTTSVPSFLILADLLRTSQLLAVMPKRLALNSSGLTTIRLPLEIPGFTKTMVWHPRSHHNLAHQWLRNRIVELLQS